MKDPRVDVILKYLASRDPRWERPVSPESQDLYNQVAQLAKEIGHSPKADAEDRMIRVKKELHELGMPAHIQGYVFCAKAICICVENPKYLHGNMTKELYPEVAQEYGSAPSRVERAMRHAIEVAWTRGDVDYLHKVFGNSISVDKYKPTNSEFLAMVSEKIIMDEEEQNA